MIHILYRLSDNGYVRTKFEFATKAFCLENCKLAFIEAQLYLFLDSTNLTDKTTNSIHISRFTKVINHSAGSSAASFKLVFDYALDNLADDDIVYFLEDDYLHRYDEPGPATLIAEGLEIADYVSLYDHLDKYIPASKGGNPFIDETGGEVTRVVLTKHSHWKLTNSTTMTFATKVKTLREDKEIWERHISGTYPRDFDAFMELLHKNRALVTPIPGWSTHCMPEWASPLIEWKNI